jgi:hypothetical protein
MAKKIKTAHKNGNGVEYSINQEATERKIQTQIARQTHLDGIADDLQKACDEVIDLKIAKAEIKVKMEQACDKVIIEMKKSGRDLLKLSHSGETWEFRVLSSEEALRVAKVTKTPAYDEDQPELPVGGAE